MRDFKSGLINCIGTIITIPLLILFIVFASIHKTTFYIVLFTLFATFSLLYFLFSTLYSWISNETAQKVFKRFINIFKILTLAVVFIILAFTNVTEMLKLMFLFLIVTLAVIYTVFASIWENIPKILLSLLSISTYISFSVFLLMLLFV